jgi:hypothetical protein
MLNAHPDIYITQESGFYQWSRPDRLRGCTTARAWFEGYARTASFRLLGVAPEPILAEIPPDLPRAAAGPFLAPRVLGATARRLGRPRWGDKTPLHSQRLEAIFADFPEARVIHVVRHPLPTVSSILRMPWGCDSVVVNALLLREVTRAVSRCLRRFHGQILLLRLEDLVADPRAALARVLDHLEVPWDDRVLQPDRYSYVTDDPALPWLSDAAAPVAARPWRRDLTPAQIHLVERFGVEAMEMYGYAPDAQGEAPGLFALSWTLLADLWTAARFLWRMLRSAPPLSRPDQIDALAQLRWLFHLNPSDRVPAAWREVPEALQRRLDGTISD